MSRRNRRNRVQTAPTANPTLIAHRDHFHDDVRELNRCEDADLHAAIEDYFASMDELWAERVPEPVIVQY